MSTSNLTVIARPYAVAAFEYAVAENAIADWQAMLDAAALIVKDAAVQKLMMNLMCLFKQVTGLFVDC